MVWVIGITYVPRTFEQHQRASGFSSAARDKYDGHCLALQEKNLQDPYAQIKGGLTIMVIRILFPLEHPVNNYPPFFLILGSEIISKTGEIRETDTLLSGFLEFSLNFCQDRRQFVPPGFYPEGGCAGLIVKFPAGGVRPKWLQAVVVGFVVDR